MKDWSFDSPGPEASLGFGRALGRSIDEDGLAIALIGPLGAGKTVFAKGLAAGLGVDPRLVSSPTFVIAQQYPVTSGPEWMHHVDLYRLETEDELEGIGFYDMLAPGQVVVAEWADRFPRALGPDRLEIHFSGVATDFATGDTGEAIPEATGQPARHVRVVAHGLQAERVLADWADRADREDLRGSESDSGTGTAPGNGPARQLGGWVVLVAALLLSGGGPGAPWAATASPVCDDPHAIEDDVLGSLRVGCGKPVDAATAPVQGVGRLLWGEGLDVNQAGVERLALLPGVGPARAAAIVEERRRGPFSRAVDLERVEGIGKQTRLRLAPWLSFSGTSSYTSEAAPLRPTLERVLPDDTRPGDGHSPSEASDG